VKTTVVTVAVALQGLLSTAAEKAARGTGLVQRHRKLSGAAWVQTLVFGWARQPDATLEDLAQQAHRLDVRITPQGLDRWFCPQGAACLKQLVQQAVGTLLHTQAVALPLLQRFTGVYVEDCTSLALPASLAAQYPGCGGNDPAGRGTASLKAYVRLELQQGQVTDLAFQPGRRPDVAAGQQAPRLPAGALRLKDLGFYDTHEMARDEAAGVHWISRLPSHVTLQVGSAAPRALAAWLAEQTQDRLDVQAVVGRVHRLPCRLIAVRCPEEIRQRRLRKLERHARDKGTQVSARQRLLCGWTVLVTNLTAGQLTADEAWVLYRLRWQVELLFKLWKSQGRLDKSLGQRGERVLCEILAKLLALLVQHWVVLTTCPWLDGIAAKRKLRVLNGSLGDVLRALHDHHQLQEVLEQIHKDLRLLRPRNRRQKKPLTLDLLNNPAAAKFGLS
jgi:Transposase DDE domain